MFCAKEMDSSNECNLKFLEAYKNESCIWDPAHSQHKNKKLINEAWLRISSVLHEEVDFLKKRKESLMATFRGHLRKKKESIKSGAVGDEVYRPIWYAYEFMESFLGRLYNCSPTIDTLEIVNLPKKHSSSRGVKRKSIQTDDSENFIKVSPPALKSNETVDVSEYEAIAINICKKLQRMNQTQAVYSESLINTILCKGLLNKLTNNTTIMENSSEGYQCVYSEHSTTSSPSYIQKAFDEEYHQD